MTASSSMVDDSTIEAHTRALAPTTLSMSWLPAPMTVPCPTEVEPRRMTLGSMVTSAARVTPQSR